VPKKGKKKVVKLGPCGDKAVAGTKLLQVVHRELEEYGAPQIGPCCEVLRIDS